MFQETSKTCFAWLSSSFWDGNWYSNENSRAFCLLFFYRQNYILSRKCKCFRACAVKGATEQKRRVLFSSVAELQLISFLAVLKYYFCSYFNYCFRLSFNILVQNPSFSAIHSNVICQIFSCCNGTRRSIICVHMVNLCVLSWATTVQVTCAQTVWCVRSSWDLRFSQQRVWRLLCPGM